MSKFIIYRNKSDKKIAKISKTRENKPLLELKELAKNWDDPDRSAEINENSLIGEILDYLEETDQLKEDWKTSIKTDLLDNIRRSQSELNDLEQFVNNFGDTE